MRTRSGRRYRDQQAQEMQTANEDYVERLARAEAEAARDVAVIKSRGLYLDGTSDGRRPMYVVFDVPVTES